ncbi:MAG TPA: futalosine hydrolase [Candidatus Cybelea sp.]|nr:futalosine hydrolase [Candidatus Cybelea sp.]
MILLCCAVEAELAFWHPRGGVDMLVSGVGPVEAASAVAAALANDKYRLVVNAGIAGAFDGAAAIGDGVVVSEERMELRLESGEAFSLPRGASTVESARSDASLVARLQAAGFAALRGVTVSRVTSSEATAQRLAQSLGAQVESMEGFAVLRAAERAGIAAIEVRGISNRCGARERSGWDFAAGVSGLRNVAAALLELCTP